MKLPTDSLISPEKLTNYLLAPRKRNDKSQWLLQGGYSAGNWRILEKNLRSQFLSLDAVPAEDTPFGQFYEIAGELVGPNGNHLAAITIWMVEKATGIIKFITMYPDKGRTK
jgi:hypothetical protein